MNKPISDERRAELKNIYGRTYPDAWNGERYLSQEERRQVQADLLALLDAPPAPKPISLPERIKELMVEVCAWQTSGDTKKYPWTEEDKKAFGEVLRILEHYGRTVPKVVSWHWITEFITATDAKREGMLRDLGYAAEPEEGEK